MQEFSFRLRPKIAALLPALCGWQNAEASPRVELERLWNLIMGYDAPLSERKAWLEFFLEGDGMDPKPGSERVSALFETMFMNPFFILQE